MVIIKDSKKNYSTAFFISLLTISMVSIFFYAFFYRPMQQNKELFPKRPPAVSEYASEQTKNDFGITLDQAKMKKNVYFVDGREIEEYNEGHISGATHLRSNDLDIEKLKETLKINGGDFEKSLIVVYCHDGTRSSNAAQKLGKTNIKFLLDSPAILKNKQGLEKSAGPAIDSDFQNRDFSVSADRAKELSKKGVLTIDGRFEFKKEIPDSLFFRIGNLTSKQYASEIQNITKDKQRPLLYIADTYADLFYAKILFQRLVKDFEFPINNLNILFNESEGLIGR